MSDKIEDGGPAFPFGQVSELTGQPINGFFNPGMSLRDYFAGQAMPSLMEESRWQDELRKGWEPALSDLATTAYTIADAMLVARKGGAA